MHLTAHVARSAPSQKGLKTRQRRPARQAAMFPEGVLSYVRYRVLVNSLPVESLAMAGLLAERAPNVARGKGVGMAGLLEADLPDHLAMSLDGRGVCKVGLFPEDKYLALAVAKSVVAKLSGVGLMARDSGAPVRSGSGKKRGDHGMLLELVCDDEGGLPLVVMRGSSTEGCKS
jgi:hypothetical protein